MTYELRHFLPLATETKGFLSIELAGVGPQEFFVLPLYKIQLIDLYTFEQPYSIKDRIDKRQT
jgi:hypothetical protein